MTCKDCIHNCMCGQKEDLVQIDDCNLAEFGKCENVEMLCEAFKNKADFVEVRHGKWLDVIEEVNNTCAGITFKGFVGYKCSLCGRQEIRKEPYCHCGAKMSSQL